MLAQMLSGISLLFQGRKMPPMSPPYFITARYALPLQSRWGFRGMRHPFSTEIASSLALLAKTVGGYAEVASRSLP